MRANLKFLSAFTFYKAVFSTSHVPRIFLCLFGMKGGTCSQCRPFIEGKKPQGYGWFQYILFGKRNLSEVGFLTILKIKIFKNVL